jgi:hypothetical protein
MYSMKKIIGKCGPCPVFAGYTLAFALQLRKKHGKTSAMVVSLGINKSKPTRNIKSNPDILRHNLPCLLLFNQTVLFVIKRLVTGIEMFVPLFLWYVCTSLKLYMWSSQLTTGNQNLCP